MLIKNQTENNSSSSASLDSLAGDMYREMINSLEDTDDMLDIFADACRELAFFVMKDFLYSVFDGTDTGYKHFSNKDPKTSVRDILNAEALLSGDFDCPNSTRKQAKEYFDSSTLSLLFSLRMTSDSVDDNIGLLESIFDTRRGDRTYIKTNKANKRDKDIAICKLLSTCYAMSSKDIASRMGISQNRVYKLLSAWDDNKDGLYFRLYKYLYARIISMRKRLLEDQDGHIFIRDSKNSKEYISIDTKNTFLKPTILKEDMVDDMIYDFKKKKENRGMVTSLGIDISKYNGSCDMLAAKAEGIKFVIIKAGSSYSGQDPNWVKNYKACKKAGLGVGAYWYSYAVTVEEAKREADMFLDCLEGMQFDYPVYLDMEDKCQAKLSKELRTRIAKTFLKRVESAGYYVGLYSMKSWFDDYFNMEELKEFDLWIARWFSKTHGYNGPGLVGMWQYSNKAHFNGIGTTSEGGVDANLAYIEYPIIIKKKGLNNYKKKPDYKNN